MWGKLGDLALRVALWAFLLLMVGRCLTTTFMAMRAQYGRG